MFFISMRKSYKILDVFNTLKENNVFPLDELIKEAARLEKINYQAM